MKCENGCVCARKELEKEIQARAPQGTLNTRHPSALPRYATLPCGASSDRPETRLEQARLLEHPNFPGACQRKPHSKGGRVHRGFYIHVFSPVHFHPLLQAKGPISGYQGWCHTSTRAAPQEAWLLSLGKGQAISPRTPRDLVPPLPRETDIP